MAISFRAAGTVVNNATGNITLTAPASTTNTDVVLAGFHYLGGTGVTITAPTGWTLANRTDNSTVDGTAVYWGLGSASFTAWTVTGQTRIIGFTLGYIGVATLIPMDVTGAGQVNASSATGTAPSVTTITPNVWGVCFFGFNNLDTFTDTSPLVHRQDGSAGTGATKASIGAGDFPTTTPGATGAQTTTGSIAAINEGITVALRPLLQADEDFWNNPVNPVQATFYQKLPLGDPSDDNWVPPLNPALVQRVAYGALDVNRGLTDTAFTIRLPNKTLASNCLVLIVDNTDGNTVASIVGKDTSGTTVQTWSATPVVTATNASTMRTTAYIQAGATAGVQWITITFTATENNCHFLFMEWRNIATSSAVGVTSQSNTAAAPNISAPALSPTSGDLLLHYCFNNANIIGSAGNVIVTSWTAGSSFTLEAADFASGAATPQDMSFYALQTRIAPGGSVTPTLTTTGTGAANTIAFSLKAASAGTAPAATGIRILRQQYYTNTGLTPNANWSEPFPCSGNLLVLYEDVGLIQTAPSDSLNGTWTLAVPGINASQVACAYKKNPITGSTNVLTFPIANVAGANTTVIVYDIVGADTTNPLVDHTGHESNIVGGCVIQAPTAVVPGSVPHMPDITPLIPNGLIINQVADGHGPLTALTAPTGALFNSITYPNETDFDSFDNAGGTGDFYYGSTMTLQNWTWTNTQTTSLWATAAEWRAAGPPDEDFWSVFRPIIDTSISTLFS